MKEFKFRAWDKENKTMIDMDTLAEDWGFCVFYQHEVDHGLEIMQYTGLKDKNGKEIYEGDIVDARAGEHCQGFWEHALRKTITDFAVDIFTLSNYEHLEVVGNIYDNPEMLTDEV